MPEPILGPSAKKNYKNLYRGLATVILILALATAAYFVFMKKDKPADNNEQQTNQPPPPPPPPASILPETFKSTEYGVEFTYQEGYQKYGPGATEVVQTSFLKPNGAVLQTISVPKSFYPDTNLSQATLTVSGNTNSNATDCKQMNDSGQISSLKDTIHLGDYDYSTAKTSEAAAGTRYDNRVFHILNSGVCIEYNILVSYANIGNFESGTVKEVDVNEAFSRIQGIISSAQYVQPQLTVGNKKLYTNKQHGFAFDYNNGVAVGETAKNSSLGTADVAVPGIYVGHYVFVVAETEKLRKEAADYVNQMVATAKNPPPPSEEGFPSIECKAETVKNTISIQLVSCTGEGGPAVYGLIKGSKYDIFIDGYSRGWDGSKNLKNLPYEDLKKMLETFKYIS